MDFAQLCSANSKAIHCAHGQQYLQQLRMTAGACSGVVRPKSHGLAAGIIAGPVRQSTTHHTLVPGAAQRAALAVAWPSAGSSDEWPTNQHGAKRTTARLEC